MYHVKMMDYVEQKPKILKIDSSFVVKVQDHDSRKTAWHLKSGKTLEVEWLDAYDGNVIEFEIKVLGLESYVDLRDRTDTLEDSVRSLLSSSLGSYACEEDSKLTTKALELKEKLLELFELEKTNA